MVVGTGVRNGHQNRHQRSKSHSFPLVGSPLFHQSRESQLAQHRTLREGFVFRVFCWIQKKVPTSQLTISRRLCIYTSVSDELDMTAVQNCVCFNLRWVTRAVTQFYDAEMRRQGIRPTQGTILVSLNAKEHWSMAELSDWLGMERTTLVRNLRPLQRDGLVQAIGGGHGNRVELAITDKGRKQIEKLTPAWRSAQCAAVKTLGEKRWSEILSDLETAALALNK